MKIERRYTAGFDAADDTKRISGYAAVFYRDDDPGTEYQLAADITERIMPGSFDRALLEDDVRALYNHDPDHILGRNTAGTLRLSVDDRGLRYDVDLPDTQLARDLYQSIKRGDITGSSFAFTIPSDGQSWREDNDRVIREIRSVSLMDVGPVTFPAYQSSTTNARSDYHQHRDSLPDERAVYKGQEILTVPTDEMVAEAQKGLDLREEFGRGGTEVGVARARDIINRRNLSIDTVQRMASYFARHEIDKEADGWREGEEGYPSAGKIAWLLWGGDPGRRWAERILAEVAEIDEAEMEMAGRSAVATEPEPDPDPVDDDDSISIDVIVATARLREIESGL